MVRSHCDVRRRFLQNQPSQQFFALLTEHDFHGFGNSLDDGTSCILFNKSTSAGSGDAYKERLRDMIVVFYSSVPSWIPESEISYFVPGYAFNEDQALRLCR